MVTTLSFPDSWTPWIEKRRLELGLRSRQAFILHCMKQEAGIPDEPKPEETWPVEERQMRCPECYDDNGLTGQHCRGKHRATLLNDRVAKVRVRYVCVCPECKSL